jgi:protein SCO1
MCSCRRLARLAILLSPLALLAAVACRKAPPVREFAVVGQVVAIDRSTNYVTLRHEDIKGFMPGMTMPFAVKDPALLEGKVPGDLVAATLQVQDTDAWITRLTKTGSAPLPPRAEAPMPGLAPGDRAPDQAFVDQGGRRLTMEWADGHIAVVTFIYTRCPFQDFCPAIDRRFVELQDAIKSASGSSGSLADVRLLSVSIDPAFDQPAVLQAHASKLGADPKVWRFVTAPPAEIAAFGRQFGLDVRQTSPAPADIVHNLRTVVLDRKRRIVENRTGSDWTAADLLARLRTVAGA